MQCRGVGRRCTTRTIIIVTGHFRGSNWSGSRHSSAGQYGKGNQRIKPRRPGHRNAVLGELHHVAKVEVRQARVGLHRLRLVLSGGGREVAGDTLRLQARDVELQRLVIIEADQPGSRTCDGTRDGARSLSSEGEQLAVCGRKRGVVRSRGRDIGYGSDISGVDSGVKGHQGCVEEQRRRGNKEVVEGLNDRVELSLLAAGAVVGADR